MYNLRKIDRIIIYSIFLLISVNFSCTRTEKFPVGRKVYCNAEQVKKKRDKFIAENDSAVFLDGGHLQSSLESFSGKYSAMTIPKKKAFAFGYSINHAGPDWYFKVSVWRKSKDGKGALVAAAKNNKKLYLAVSEPVEKKDGWEKLELEVFTPPTFNYEKLKFYVWNNGSDTVFFDDLVIERFRKKVFPVYREEPLAIVLDTSAMIKIMEKRKQAFENGILETTDKDWVKGFIIGNNEAMKARFRLKGDWLDHLIGDKWSFRIKMRKKYAWNRLRVFSIQTPAARNFLYEWVAHKFYQSGDMLTTRYGFIPVYLNNESRGIYAWEEHFVKQLIEFNNRREGPILKFTEDPFWQIQKIFLNTGKWQQLPYYESSVIRPFGENKTLRSPSLRQQFFNAQRLMFQYKHGLKKPSDIFDLEKLANYYAMLEVTHARHGMFWHNQRYYYNPVIDKLEPISFDGYSTDTPMDISLEENFLYKIYDLEEVNPETELFTYLFYDKEFLERYFEKLEKVSDPDFIETFLKNHTAEQTLYDSLVRIEFPRFEFDPDYIRKSAASIRNYLPELKKLAFKKLDTGKPYFKKAQLNYTDTTVFQNTPEYFVNVYKQSDEVDTFLIKICNYFPGELTILGTGASRKYMSGIDIGQHKVPAYHHGLSGSEITMKVDSSAKYLYFLVNNRFDTYVVPIISWAYPSGSTARQELDSLAQISHYSFISHRSGNELFVKPGMYSITAPVVIPEGYKVIFQAGAKLDLTDSALFVSYSPVYMMGTSENPVTITSSDFSANGFTVLQAKERSVLKNVLFENLNTLDYKGWTLTGAVTFYESDVDMRNVRFYRNQCEDALNTVRSEFSLDNCSFDYIYSDAFDSDFCTGVLSNSTFENTGNDAIDFSGSKIRISRCSIKDVKDKGISGGEDSHLTVDNVDIVRANIGVSSKDLSNIKIDGGQITDCNYGLVLLRKKPEYGPATIEMKNVTIVNARTKMLIEKGSKVNADGKLIEGKEKDLAARFY